MISPVKTQVGNGLSKLFNLRGQTIGVSDQAIITLKDSGIHDEEGKKMNISEPLTATKSLSGHFVLLMMIVHPYHSDQNCKNSRMNFRACVQFPLDVDGIYASIDTQMLTFPHILLVHLADLDNGRNPDIGTRKKDRGDIFSECFTESFKAKFLRCVNEVLFETVKTVLKDKYLGVKPPTALQNKVCTFRKCTTIKRLGYG